MSNASYYVSPGGIFLNPLHLAAVIQGAPL